MFELAKADLHMHSIYSDGRYTPRELVRKAQLLGLRAIALTDHDSIEGLPEAVEAGRVSGVEVVTGVELSVDVAGREMHLLGYMFDPENASLRRYLSNVREGRRERARRMVDALAKAGVIIDPESLIANATGAVGRPHVAQALVEAGYVKTYQEAFSKYIGDAQMAFVPKSMCSGEEAIHLIRRAGGLSVIAHPGAVHNPFAINHLIAAGVDGIEYIHPSHDRETMQYFAEFGKVSGLLLTGGSDFHGHRHSEERDRSRWTVSYRRVEQLRLRNAA